MGILSGIATAGGGSVGYADHGGHGFLGKQQPAGGQGQADAPLRVQDGAEGRLLGKGKIPVAGAEAGRQTGGGKGLRQVFAKIIADVFNGGASPRTPR